MSKEKQIEEMAKAICGLNTEQGCFCDGGYCNYNCLSYEKAIKLYNAGYRKQSEVIDEFSDRLKEAPIKLGLPLLGLSTKEEIEEYFDGIMLQVRDAIDKIAKEMKGDEK